jgi:EpsI family protein
MTTNRLFILLAVMLGGMSTVFLLPKQLASQPLGIEMQLPQYLGGWLGTDLQISERERQVLGPETEFARKAYRNVQGDELHVSIVLGGQDMNTSIHRPERCLPAQGWTITNKSTAAVVLPGKGSLHTTRLHNLRNLTGADNKPLPIYNLNFYWFAGHNDVTGSHLQRTVIDIKDRVLRGYNQRWAYITVAATITKDLTINGRSEEETDELIRNFIKLLAPKIHKETVDFG